jgi:hypothetical protein
MLTRCVFLCLFLQLVGCATLERHPYATSFAVALVAGSIAASGQHDNRVGHAPGTAGIGTPSCIGATCQ